MRLAFKSVRQAGIVAVVVAASIATAGAQDGVSVSRKSIFRNVVSAASIEQQAGLQYEQMTRQAYQKRALVEQSHPQARRLRKIADDLLPHANRFNERAKAWKWEVNLFASPQINAF